MENMAAMKDIILETAAGILQLIQTDSTAMFFVTCGIMFTIVSFINALLTIGRSHR